ncbi:transcriptional regulator [Aestuariivirga sp.]|uniref:helix-turn-helix transcriptional regulator n=1 Tax=Aestuariivirga sp. TaxID=2650926 RepID=UPI00391D9E5D
MTKTAKRMKHSVTRHVRSQAERKLDLLAELVPLLARAVGPLCEVVLHQNTTSPPTIRAIGNGHITNRAIGDLMTQIFVDGHDDTRRADALFNYMSTMPDGRQIRVSLIPVRHGRQVIGYIAVNFLVHDLEMAVQALSMLSKPEPHDFAITENFTSPRQVIVQTATEYLRLKGRTLALLSTKERRSLVKHLKARGIFQMRRAVDEVAGLLGISRAAVYNYLSAMK